MRTPTLLLSALLTLPASTPYAQSTTGQPGPSGVGSDLPSIGTPADSVWTQDEEYQVGRMVMKGLRDAGQLLEDPEINGYLQDVGAQLASHTQNGGQRFTFFAVKGQQINAFALPGGFIGVNAGLLLATRNESELAGVLAHEIAHVTQRHIARGVKAQSRSALVSAAALLAAILVGAAGGDGDAMMGAIAMAQGAALQQQLNFTRANEYEADRIGIGTLAAAGFEPQAMPDFFETLGRQYGSRPGYIPELLQTHPLTANRIAEARNRAREFGPRDTGDSTGYVLARERLRVLTAPGEMDPATYYERLISTQEQLGDGHHYGRALALMSSNRPEEAIPILEKLSSADPAIIQYRSALGEALMLAGRVEDSLNTFEQAMRLFPRNVPLTMRYARGLMRADQARLAHQVLLDLFNAVAPTPEQARFIALCANAAGDVADAYSYMAEYHVMSGELLLAINQLELALGVPNLSEVQKARFKARMEQLQEYAPKGESRLARRGGSRDDDDNSRRQPRQGRMPAF
jgi:predicted Zn-dependent protease